MQKRKVFSRILVPVDGSRLSCDAAEYAVGIAKLARAHVIALHVVHLPTYTFAYAGGEGVSPMSMPAPLPLELSDEERKMARRIVDDVKDVGEKVGVEIETKVIEQHPSVPDAIIHFAEENKIDLIVMGTKGKTGIRRFLLGSVTESVVHHAHCPVLVVR